MEAHWCASAIAEKALAALAIVRGDSHAGVDVEAARATHPALALGRRGHVQIIELLAPEKRHELAQAERS